MVEVVLWQLQRMTYDLNDPNKIYLAVLKIISSEHHP
jgi:hypothetical protein